jgi:hypothetical protein
MLLLEVFISFVRIWKDNARQITIPKSVKDEFGSPWIIRPSSRSLFVVGIFTFSSKRNKKSFFIRFKTHKRNPWNEMNVLCLFESVHYLENLLLYDLIWIKNETLLLNNKKTIFDCRLFFHSLLNQLQWIKTLVFCYPQPGKRKLMNGWLKTSLLLIMQDLLLVRA